MVGVHFFTRTLRKLAKSVRVVHFFNWPQGGWGGGGGAGWLTGWDPHDLIQDVVGAYFVNKTLTTVR